MCMQAHVKGGGAWKVGYPSPPAEAYEFRTPGKITNDKQRCYNEKLAKLLLSLSDTSKRAAS